MIHRKWTPVELTVLLACYYNAEPNNGLAATPAHENALAMWEALGYIEFWRGEICLYNVTDRGQFMVDALCSTPGWWVA